MAKVSGPDVAKAAHAAGFPDGELVTAVAIAWAESSLDADATHRNGDGSVDYGLWQINSVHQFPEFASGAWRDPKTNAQMAYRVWKSQGWNAWSTHKVTDALGYARYAGYISSGAAATAVIAAGFPGAIPKGIAGVPGDVGETVAGTGSDVVDKTTSLLKEPLAVLRWLEQPDTWIRVTKQMIGLSLLGIGAYLVFQATIFRNGTGAVKTVVGLGGKLKSVKNAAKQVGS